MIQVATTVREVRRETADAKTFRLDLEGADFPYRPGQHIHIDPYQFEDLRPALRPIEERKQIRVGPGFFALCSPAIDRDHVEVTVKAPPPGGWTPPLVTFLLSRVDVGTRMTIAGPGGGYCLPESPPAGVRGFLHLCAGSGVAPNRGMIVHALMKGWPQRQLLCLQNRSEDDILYRSEWEDLARRHGDRLRVRHAFSATRGEYLSADVLRAEMDGFPDAAASMAFVCGPNRPREIAAPDGGRKEQPGFCDLWCGSAKRGVKGLLPAMGFPPDRVLSAMP